MPAFMINPTWTCLDLPTPGLNLRVPCANCGSDRVVRVYHEDPQTPTSDRLVVRMALDPASGRIKPAAFCATCRERI